MPFPPDASVVLVSAIWVLSGLLCRFGLVTSPWEISYTIEYTTSGRAPPPLPGTALKRGGATREDVEIPFRLPGRAADEEAVDVRTGDQLGTVAGIDRAAVEAWRATTEDGFCDG